MDRRIGVMRVEGGTRDVVVGPYRVGIDRAGPVEDGRGEGLDRVEREEDGHRLDRWVRVQHHIVLCIERQRIGGDGRGRIGRLNSRHG